MTDNIIDVLAPYFRALGLELEVEGDKVVTRRTDRPVRYVWAGVDEPAVEVEDVGAQIAAAEKLLDRIFGKARQALEHTGADGGPIEVAETMDLRRLTDEQLDQLEGLVTHATPPAHRR